jgi:hypothetical protein
LRLCPRRNRPVFSIARRCRKLALLVAGRRPELVADNDQRFALLVAVLARATSPPSTSG